MQGGWHDMTRRIVSEKAMLGCKMIMESRVMLRLNTWQEVNHDFRQLKTSRGNSNFWTRRGLSWMPKMWQSWLNKMSRQSILNAVDRSRARADTWHFNFCVPKLPVHSYCVLMMWKYSQYIFLFIHSLVYCEFKSGKEYQIQINLLLQLLCHEHSCNAAWTSFFNWLSLMW